jgi:hypothetical protein
MLFKREGEENKAALRVSHQAFKDAMIAKAQAAGAPPPEFPSEIDNSEPHFLVKLVEENGWDDFGFLVFRTYFGNDTLWANFRDLWDPILQYGFDMTDGASAEGVASAYRLFTEDEDELEEDEKLEPGLRTRMCLFVDEECMRSVVEPGPSIPPFVKAVDVELGATTQQRVGATFRVAVKDLVTHFYPVLRLSDITDVAELRPLREDAVWMRLSLSFYGHAQQAEI